MSVLTMQGSLLIGFNSTCCALGVAPEPLLHEHGIPLLGGRLQVRLAAESVVALLEDAARLTEAPSFGLRVGCQWQLAREGPMALLLLESQQLGDFLLRLQRYADAINQALRYMVVNESGSEVALCFLPQSPVVGHSLQLVELMTARILTVIRGILGPEWRPRAVMFQHQPQFSQQLYGQLLDSRVIFSGDLNGLLLDQSDLKCPLKIPPEQVQSSVTCYLDELLLPERGALPEQVKKMMVELFSTGQSVSLKQIAKLQALAPRTLQYQLKCEGHSFRDLQAEVQAQVAANLLREQRLSVAEVAGMLGFSETSAFSRAFQRWHGQAPSRFGRMSGGGE